MTTARAANDKLQMLERRQQPTWGEINHMAAVVEERDDAIATICQDVQQINDMFNDVLALTIAQRDDVDSIEAHIDAAVHSTNDGVRNLREADKYQRNSTCLLS
jgi:t-SNARE complex subunit (syntaxin)